MISKENDEEKLQELKEKEQELQERIKKIEDLEKVVREKEKIQKENENKKKQILLRIAPSLWNDLAQWAEEDFRSINGQIEFLLSENVKKHKGK